MNSITEALKIKSKQKVLILLCLSVIVVATIASTTHFTLATQENKTLIQPQGTQVMSNTTSNATNIVLVHGLWADGSSWSKVIPTLEKAGHKVIAVQLPAHSLAETET